jgi:hypothetical protein
MMCDIYNMLILAAPAVAESLAAATVPVLLQGIAAYPLVLQRAA